MTGKLSELMQDLPQNVVDINDAKRLSVKWESNSSTLFYKGTIMKTIGFIEPGENIYLFTWGTDLGLTVETTGVLFISDKRIVHRANSASGFTEIPLSDIRTVAAGEGLLFGNISFKTHNRPYEFRFVTKENIPHVRDMIIYLAAQASAGGSVTGLTLSEMHAASVAECPGCSASVILQGGVGKCEYCDRYVGDKKEPPAPAVQNPPPQPAAMPLGGVADEIKKYKELFDMGAISADEFNAAKTKLLERM